MNSANQKNRAHLKPVQLDEPFREKFNNPRARIGFKRRTFEIITSLEKFYFSDQFLSQFQPLHSVFSLGSPLSFFVWLNLTSRIISGNGRKQVSVYRRLQKHVKLCKLILREAEPCTNSRRAPDRSFVLFNSLILSSRSYFRPECNLITQQQKFYCVILFCKIGFLEILL